MQRLLVANRRLLLLFAVASGLYKMFGQADIALFARLGMVPLAVVVFGVIQALAGAALASPVTRRPAAFVLLASNMLATTALFAANVQPFGTISLVFVAMAFAAIFDRPVPELEPLRT